MTADPVLAALSDGDWRSGQALAAELGVTRAAVWKAIERLRREGYEIEAEPGRGYRLVRPPDRLLPAEIERHFRRRLLAGDIVHRDLVDSTNRLAIELARGGAVEGTAVVAERQTAGRGRLGRTWESPPGTNLYLSVVLRPALSPLEVPRLTLAAAVAVVDAIGSTTGLRAGIKWPNDVLLEGRKACGILTELEAEAERVRFVVVGIGVNLNALEEDFPTELRAKATSLAIVLGRPVDRAAFAGTLLGALDDVYGEMLRGGFAALRPRYEAHHALVGRRVTIEGGPACDGYVRGVDDEGALLVETDAGPRRILSGEVTLEASYAGVRTDSGGLRGAPRGV